MSNTTAEQEMIEVIRHRAAGGTVEFRGKVSDEEWKRMEAFNGFNFCYFSYRPVYTKQHPSQPRHGERIQVMDDGVWVYKIFIAFNKDKAICYDDSGWVGDWTRWRFIEEPVPAPKKVRVPLTKEHFDGMPVVWLKLGHTDCLVMKIEDGGLSIADSSRSYSYLCDGGYEYSTDRREWKKCYKLEQ